MRLTCTTCIALLALAVSTSHGLAAEASVGTELNSAYVWRGITFNDGAVLQPYVDLAMPAGLGLNVWGNIDLDDCGDGIEGGEWSEVDITLTYTRAAGPAEISAGYIEYLFPHQGGTNGALAGTREVFVGVSMPLPGGLSAGVSANYDIDEFDDIYVSVELGYSAELSDKLTLDLGASAGYVGNDAALGTEGGMNEYALSAGLAYALSDSLELDAHAGHTDSISSDTLPEQDVDFYGGIGICWSL